MIALRGTAVRPLAVLPQRNDIAAVELLKFGQPGRTVRALSREMRQMGLYV